MAGFTQTERLLSIFTTLRPGEGRSALLLCLQSFAIMLAYYMLKVIRDPLILAAGAAELKTYTTGVQAVLLIFIVPMFAHAYHRISTKREKYHLLRNILMFFTANLVLFAIAYQAGLPIAIAYYIWLGIFSVIVLATFWAYAADLYNRKSGQRIFPLIASASALGAFLGSGLTGFIDPLIGHGGVMWLAAALLLVPWYICLWIENNIPAGSQSASVSRPEEEDSLLIGFKLVLRSRYLSMIAVFVIIFNLINTNGDYIMARLVSETAALVEARGEMSADQYLTVFYAEFNAVFTALAFIIQLFLVARVFDWIGVRGALLVLPIFMVASYTVMMIFPLLWLVRAAMISENSLANSLQSTTRHALFLPVSREEKYVGKHTIDTFFFRFGDVFSTLFVYVASGLLSLGLTSFIGINAVLSILLTGVAVAITRSHKLVIEENPENLPPVVAAQMDDLILKAGEVTRVDLAEQLFVDPDEGDALRYMAQTAQGERLPGWIKFDSLSRSFHFSPPASVSGEIDIRIVARDFDGLEADIVIKVTYR